MALVLQRICEAPFWIFSELRDPRTDDIFLAKSLIVPLLIISTYIYVVRILGPAFMKNRKPYDLKNVIIAYNAVQVGLNTYCFYKNIKRVMINSWDCAPVDFSNSQQGLEELRLVYFYYVLKLTDLLDTVFFVLRKSYRQVSFLHIYHHAVMIMSSWTALRFFAGGHILWVSLLNCFVHILMYFYYMLSAADEKWKRSQGFKKVLTQIQIIQFILVILIFGRLLLKPECNFTNLACYVLVTQGSFMVTLFSNFYLKTYTK